MAQTWRERFCSTNQGVCDFLPNYRYYFKWLLGLLSSTIIIRGKTKTGTIDKEYLKKTLILEGIAGVTDFDGKLYGMNGTLGGAPTEYYIPASMIIANPILGSKVMYWRDFKDQKQNGVLICNTPVDRFVANSEICGFYDLIHQTATLLADNIVSISCAQINTRVQNFIKGYSTTQVETAKTALKELYSGRPYTPLQSDIMEDVKIEPAFTGTPSQSITELVELNNYIISDFLKKSGVAANVVMKRERLVTDEVNAQNDFVGLCMTQMLGSWKTGFDEVNEFYAKYIEEDFSVDINPAIVKTLLDLLLPAQPQEPAGVSAGLADPEDSPAESTDPAQPQEPEEGAAENEGGEGSAEDNAGTEPEEIQETAEVVEETLEEQADAVEAIAEALTGEPLGEDPEEGGGENAENENQ